MTNIIKNDKSTVRDEMKLFLIIIVCITVGFLLIKFKPAIWMIERVHTTVLGALLVLAGVMGIPGLIYRIFMNDKKQRKGA